VAATYSGLVGSLGSTAASFAVCAAIGGGWEGGLACALAFQIGNFELAPLVERAAEEGKCLSLQYPGPKAFYEGDQDEPPKLVAKRFDPGVSIDNGVGCQDGLPR
jgi:hypothetical protein